MTPEYDMGQNGLHPGPSAAPDFKWAEYWRGHDDGVRARQASANQSPFGTANLPDPWSQNSAHYGHFASAAGGWDGDGIIPLIAGVILLGVIVVSTWPFIPIMIGVLVACVWVMDKLMDRFMEAEIPVLDRLEDRLIAWKKRRQRGN